MSEQAQTSTGRTRPEIRGKVIAVLDEWRNNAGTFWKREVVVETGLRFPNPLKVSFQKEATSHLDGVTEGDCVIIPYVLNGREYDGRYYTDIVGMGLQKIVGGTSGGGNGGAAPAAAAAKPVLGCTAATAIEEWAKNHGDDKAGFAEFCKQLKPGKPSKQYTIADWADVVNAIQAADAQAAQAADNGATDPDDLPF